MAKLLFDTLPLEAEAGKTLLSCLPPDGRPDSPCGGAGRCGKCRVRARGALSPVTSEEKRLLTPQELAEGVRLACCAKVLGDCSAESLNPGSSAAKIRIEGLLPEFEKKPDFTKLGAAVDLGTTTVAAILYEGAVPLKKASCENSQKVFGADVISRIGRSLAGEKEALARAVRGDIASLLTEMTREAGRELSELQELVITGNTAMLYLLTAADPACLAAAPFVADDLFGRESSARELELPCPEAKLYLPPCMSAFVGADITTAVLASGIFDSEKTSLLADIGTNGEMTLSFGGKLLCCSTAAGPAFEGAGIAMGMMGKPGAIDTVRVENGALSVHVIGDLAPVGICGSGIIDAVAAAMELGVMDENGLLETEEEYAGDPCLHLSGPVVLTQKDIRMVQLAKSAVHAGCLTLLQEGNLSCREVDSFHIAGGFGSFLDTANAAKIGLIPRELLPKTRVLGNAALSGAAMLLLNPNHREKAARIAALPRPWSFPPVPPSWSFMWTLCIFCPKL